MALKFKMRKSLAAALASFMLLGNAGSVWNAEILHNITIAAEDSLSIGRIVEESSMMIGPDMEQTIYEIQGASGTQRVYKLETDPFNEFFQVVTGISNEKVNGHETTTSMAERLKAEGHNVVAAVNGDFYDVPSGIPIGMMIKDGEIIETSSNWHAIGFTPSKNTVIGTPSFKMSFETLENPGETFEITHINRRRSTDDLILYNSKYGTDTMTNPYGTEVVLNVTSGSPKSGQKMTAVVEEVIDEAGSTPIRDGKIVLSGHGEIREKLKSLKSGDAISMSFEAEGQWANVAEAIGGKDILLKNGQIQEGLDNVKHPRTAIGTKADGSLIVVAVDGRQPQLSEGVSLRELAQMMKEMGAVNALNLDGGGSTTFAARQPGEENLTIKNSPSDGEERKNANGLIFISTAPRGSLSKLVISPDKLRIMAGTEYSFQAKGVDEHYNPAALTDTVFWAAEGRVGEITNTGKFKAAKSAADGKIRALSQNAGGEVPVEVVSEITELKITPESFSISPGDKIQLKAEAYIDGKRVVSENSSFDWKVSDDIGTVDQNGLFTAKNKAGLNGKVTASFNGVKSESKAAVGKLPIVLESFDSGISNWRQSGAEYNSISLSKASLSHGDPVKSGSSALKVSYDFKGKAGTSGVYAGAKEYIEIPDYPDKVGMWVYGDGNGHWLRGQLRDGNDSVFSVDFTSAVPGLDWTGWRYVEAEIPKGKASPIKIDLAVRYMETNANRKDAGAIYIDDITASYGTVEVKDEVEETPIEEELIFQDTKGHWAEDDIMALYNLKIVNGSVGTDGKSYYHPENNISRQEFAKLIVESQNIEISSSSSSFRFEDDSKIQDWAKKYVYAAYEAGVIQGSPDINGKLWFNPARNITRADIVTMIGRSLEQESSLELKFSDNSEIPAYAKSHVALCVERGIVNGYPDGSFAPLSNASRAESAKIINQLMK